MYSLEIVIRDLPKRYNTAPGAHWASRYAETKKWRRLIGNELYTRLPDKPLERAKLTLIRYSSAEPDYDNLVMSFKSIIDALKFHKVIMDDKMSNIGASEYKWEKVKPKQGMTRIIVKEAL